MAVGLVSQLSGILPVLVEDPPVILTTPLVPGDVYGVWLVRHHTKVPLSLHLIVIDCPFVFYFAVTHIFFYDDSLESCCFLVRHRWSVVNQQQYHAGATRTINTIGPHCAFQVAYTRSIS